MRIIIKKVLVILVTLVAVNSFGQNTELDKITVEMFNKTNERDFDALLEMTYPSVFDLVPKESMKNLFKTMFEGDDNMSIDLPELKPEYQLTDTFTTDDNKVDFAFMNYDMKMSMTFKNQEFDAEGQKMMINMMKIQGMEASFENANKVNVNAPNRLVIFLKDDKTKGEWKLINHDPSSPFFVELLPLEIIEKAKKRHEHILLESKKNN